MMVLAYTIYIYDIFNIVSLPDESRVGESPKRIRTGDIHNWDRIDVNIGHTKIF